MSRCLLHVCILHVSFAITLTLGACSADAAQTDDGLRQGDPIGAFYVTKVAGAVDDDVEPGEELCYRCRYGSRPMVIIFARDTGGKVAELVHRIDLVVANNEDSQLRGLLTLLGDDAGQLKAQATQEYGRARRWCDQSGRYHACGPDL